MNWFDAQNICNAVGGRWLQQPDVPAAMAGVGIDTREDLTGRVFIAIKGDRYDGHNFLSSAIERGAKLLIVHREPPRDLRLPRDVGIVLVNDTRDALGRLALAYRRALVNTRVIAVAGSAGKTTTKRLIDGILKTVMQGSASIKSFNNDIGVPLTILNAKLSDKYLVVEVGTNHLGEIAKLAAIVEPDMAVITMIGREHLEGLGSLEQVAQENAALLNFLRPGGLVVANADATVLREHLKSIGNLVLFGVADDADLRLTSRGRNPSIRAEQGEWWFEVNGTERFELALHGKHNAINALAAIAVARHMGVQAEQIRKGLVRVQPAPMRMAVQRIGSVTILNDAYNANPESMLAALDTLAEYAIDNESGRRIVILGDMLELGHDAPEMHREIGRRLLAIDATTTIDHVVFVGGLSAFAAAEVSRKWPGTRVTLLPKVDDESAALVALLIRDGDTILLKGSRGMALERLIPAIETRFASPTTVTTDAVHHVKSGRTSITTV